MLPPPRAGIEQIFATFAERLELDGFAFDEAGAAMLAFDDVVVDIEIRETEGRVVLAAMQPEPATPAPLLHERLLEANFTWSETSGATVARVPGGGVLILRQALPTWDLDVDRLTTALEGFVAAAEHLAAMVDDDGPAETGFEASEPGAIRV